MTEADALLKEAVKIIHCHLRNVEKDWLLRAREYQKSMSARASAVDAVLAVRSSEDRIKLAKALARAHGEALGNDYAIAAYEAGVGMTIDYWNGLAEATMSNRPKSIPSESAECSSKEPRRFTDPPPTRILREDGKPSKSRRANQMKDELS